MLCTNFKDFSDCREVLSRVGLFMDLSQYNLGTGKMVVRADVARLVLHLPQVRDQRLKCSQIVVASEMELVFM